MLKRLLQVALLTGAAHLFTLFSLKYVSVHITPARLKSTGEVDSLSNFIISIIALGLLMDAVRNIAISENWKEHFVQSQQARFTASLFLVPLGIMGLLNESYYIFLFAPFFALNGDYALYGRSYPVTASLLAFIKVLLPGITLLVASFYAPSFLIPLFILSLVVAQALSGYYVTRWLKVPLYVRPSLKSLFSYLHSLKLGLVSLSFYFIGLGVIGVATYFYPDKEVARAYLGIKLYTIFKGVIRIINQSFVKEMMNESICLRVDQLAFVAGLLFTVGGVLYPYSFTQLFLGETYVSETSSLLVLVLAGLVSAGFTSFTTKAILEKKDTVYAKWAAVAMVSTIIAAVALSFILPTLSGIYWSVLVGEVVFAFGLIRVINSSQLVVDRLKGMLQLAPLLLIPILIRLTIGDNYVALLSSCAVFGGAFLLVQRKTTAFAGAAIKV